MAVRYSGDVEVHLQWKAREGHYEGYVDAPRTPRLHMFARLPLLQRLGKKPTSSSAYDAAAREMLIVYARDCDRKYRRCYADGASRSFVIRRDFQAPCPIKCPK
jgi:hypothetical protein